MTGDPLLAKQELEFTLRRFERVGGFDCVKNHAAGDELDEAVSHIVAALVDVEEAIAEGGE